MDEFDALVADAEEHEGAGAAQRSPKRLRSTSPSPSPSAAATLEQPYVEPAAAQANLEVKQEQAEPEPAPPEAAPLDEGDEVVVIYSMSREEREREARANAVDLDAASQEEPVPRAAGGGGGGGGGGSTSASAATAAPALVASDADTAAPTLDERQQEAFDIAVGGQNLFLTGGPGTGKSFTLRLTIAALKKKHGDTGVLVTAPTGVAALIAEGQTLHTKPGPGVPKGTTEAFGNMKSKSSLDFWKKARLLVDGIARDRPRSPEIARDEPG